VKRPWGGILLVISGLLLIILIPTAMVGWPILFREPSDDQLLKRLQRYRVEFDQLVQMLGEDPQVGTIGEGFVFERGSSRATGVHRLGITTGRLADYRRLLALCGSPRVDRLNEGELAFMLWGSGLAGDTHHKGLAWSTDVLRSHDGRRYSHIRDDWYLFED
jgi:hypothetical protein